MFRGLTRLRHLPRQCSQFLRILALLRLEHESAVLLFEVFSGRRFQSLPEQINNLLL